MNDMKKFALRWACLALVLLLLPVACGEGWDVPVDRFIQRAGIEADAALARDNAEQRYFSPLIQAWNAERGGADHASARRRAVGL